MKDTIDPHPETPYWYPHSIGTTGNYALVLNFHSTEERDAYQRRLIAEREEAK